MDLTGKQSNRKAKTSKVAGAQQDDILYGLEARPLLGKRIIYALQFVIIFIGSIVLVPVIVAPQLGWDTTQSSFILQCAIFTGGLATLVQVKGIGPIGARLPILLGTTFVVVEPLVGITQAHGYDAFLGAVIAGGVVYAILGCFGQRLLQKIFSGTVSGTVVIAIALTLAPACADMMAGGSNPLGVGYAARENWLLAIVTLACCLLLQGLRFHFMKTASLLFGLLAGYLLALVMGAVDFGAVQEAAWLSIPRPFAFGIRFALEPILIMIVIYIVTMVELLGDTTATTMVAASRLPTQRELRGGILCDALSSVLSGCFNFAPNISYSDGIGIIGATRVASRSVVSCAAGLIILAGLLPKLSALLYTVPTPVLGGACIFLTGIMLMAGIAVLQLQEASLRNSIIAGISLVVGLGLGFSNVLDGAPMLLRTLLSGIPGTAFVGGFLNVVLPRKPGAGRR